MSEINTHVIAFALFFIDIRSPAMFATMDEWRKFDVICTYACALPMRYEFRYEILVKPIQVKVA